ncbi:MAG: phenylalanine--tRNA ligase subunit beta [Ignavibacteriaceae bacterium]
MKVSLNWIKEYVNLNGISIDQIVHSLTMSGLEVEDVFNQSEVYKDFIVGEVIDKSKHPDADKLSVCTVFNGQENLQVICGAPNVEKGQKIVFAPVGTVIPKGNIKISKARIRGVESFGMICSEDELELGDDHEGIMVLNDKLIPGVPITEALQLNDVIFDIAVTPNRPDALSIIGIARDLSALFSRELILPEILFEESETPAESIVTIEIRDQVNSPRYSARVIRNIKIGESPDWLKSKLWNIGLRPINNVVDVTNFVLYEFGQPLHAFDLDKLSGRKIIVKSTEDEHSFTTLDSKERMLPAGTLMICDENKEIAIAGVMGGENSEISVSTKNILIESAYFNPASVRRTSKRLGLSTEASYRFERGTDPAITITAAERAAQLIVSTAGGEVLKGTVDIYPEPVKQKEVQLRFSKVDDLLGFHINTEEILRIIVKLGYKIIYQSKDRILVKVPTYRPDVEREVDLIEEIARINGYDNIPVENKISFSIAKPVDELKFSSLLKTSATSLGLNEIVTNPLQSQWMATITGNPVKVLNPQSIDMAYLRTSLIPGVLNVISKNLNVAERNLSLFETGNVFNLNKDTGEIKTFDDFTEQGKMCIAITGKKTEKSWNTAEVYYDFFDLKGMVSALLSKISLDNSLNDSYYRNVNSIYEYYYTRSFNKKVVGSGGKVRKDVLNKFDIRQDIFVFEMDIDILKNLYSDEKKYREPLKYPKVIRDFAFILNTEVTYEDIISFIKSRSSGLLKNVTIFDLFLSETLGSNKKSMAFKLEYYDPGRTLTEEEVEKEWSELIRDIEKKFNAKLRGIQVG